MKFTKKDLKPVLVLGAICLVVALLMAVVNMVTVDTIREREEKATAISRIKVFDPTLEDEEIEALIENGVYETSDSTKKDDYIREYILTHGNVESVEELDAEALEALTAEAVATIPSVKDVSEVKKNGEFLGYAVTLGTKKGYTGNEILLTIGIDANGVIKGAIVTKNPETKDTDLTDKFFAELEGKDPQGTFDAELVAGVTYSSTAVKNAALDAFVVLGFEVPEAAPTPPIGEYTVYSTIGIIVAVLAIGGAVAYIIVKRRKGI